MQQSTDQQVRNPKDPKVSNHRQRSVDGAAEEQGDWNCQYEL
jgi:hypothetical protein